MLTRATYLNAKAQFSTTPVFANQAGHEDVETPMRGLPLSFKFKSDENKSQQIQTKLQVNEPGDEHEQEADAMAEKVTSMTGPVASDAISSSPNKLQRKCAECEEEERKKKKLQRKESRNGANKDGAGKGNATDSHSGPYGYLNGGVNSGSPLTSEQRDYFEPRFGHDFSKVRIHNDESAQQSAKAINARAYTVQNDIVFGRGEYNPHSHEGRKLLAHELTHTIQQDGGVRNTVQRAAEYGGAKNAPADWGQKVTAATDSAAKTALIQSVVGTGVSIADKTAKSASDASPDPAHLDPYTATKPVINYDDNLSSKTARAGGRSLANNAGYTLHHDNKNYVVLGSKAIDSGNYYSTLYTVNHELDHVRQQLAGSKLKGNSSELDAWTSSFIREFHKSYIIGETGTTGECRINSAQQYAPLLGYYEDSSVTSTEQAGAVKRISDYYNATIKSHPGHLAVFRYWLRSSLNKSKHQLADDIIKSLGLTITAADDFKNYTRFSCTGIPTAAYQAPSLSLPTFPAAGAPKNP